MSSKSATPKGMNIGKMIERYGSEDRCREALEALRWPDGVKCPKCDEASVSRIATRNLYECASCRYQFSVRSGTVLQDSKLPLWKWFMATFLMVESKKGISANQLRRMIGSTYRTSWFLTHRIREATRIARPKLTGTVEIDEAYIGGKPRYKGKRKGWDHKKKTTILGAVERGGDVFNHRALEWVRGDVHTNTVESVWSLFKRSIVGSYHHLSVKHMDSYLDEFEWRFNNRYNDRLFHDTLRALMRSETMTYKALTERPA